MILVLVGKSSSGKDTLMRDLVLSTDFIGVTSTTSRSIRESETNGIDYNFVSKDEFLDKIKNNDFLEYRTYETLLENKVNTWYYGTEKKSIDLIKNSVLVLDLNGLKDLKSYFPDEKIIGIYLHCPTEMRKARAKKRGSFCKSEWDRRLKADKNDFENVYSEVDYTLNSAVTTHELTLNVIKLLDGIGEN